MSPTQNLTHDTPPTPLSTDQPPRSNQPSPGRRRPIEVAAGIGLITGWAVSGFLFELAFVEVVLLGVLLLAAFQTLVRRRPVRSLLVRDTASFAHHWWGKLLVAAVLIALPAAMVVTSLGGSRYGRYADDSWKALLLLLVLAGAYLASRRLVITVLIGAVTVALLSWALAPNLADTRNGDATVLTDIHGHSDRGVLAGHHDIAVAEVDLD